MTASQALAIRLHRNDNVVVMRTDVLAGTEIGEAGIRAASHVPAGHKIATAAIDKGAAVRKYDQIIGFASSDIAQGAHVHTHNIEVHDFERDYLFCQDVKDPGMFPEASRRTFQGYRRTSGLAATRNYVGILTSVNCSATVSRYIAEAFRGSALDDYPNVDGVVALTHSTGCGMASSGEGHDQARMRLIVYTVKS